jgi:hypothetical protein
MVRVKVYSRVYLCFITSTSLFPVPFSFLKINLQNVQKNNKKLQVLIVSNSALGCDSAVFFIRNFSPNKFCFVFSLLAILLGPYLYPFFCSGMSLDHDPPTYASHVVGITAVHHHTQFICRYGISLTFYPG